MNQPSIDPVGQPLVPLPGRLRAAQSETECDLLPGHAAPAGPSSFNELRLAHETRPDRSDLDRCHPRRDGRILHGDRTRGRLVLRFEYAESPGIERAPVLSRTGPYTTTLPASTCARQYAA